MNEDSHAFCQHPELKYCRPCNVVYCRGCHQQWGHGVYWYNQFTYPNYLPYSGTSSGSLTVSTLTEGTSCEGHN